MFSTVFGHGYAILVDWEQSGVPLCTLKPDANGVGRGGDISTRGFIKARLHTLQWACAS